MRTHAYFQIQHPYVHTPTQTPIHTYIPRYIPSIYHPSIHARYTDVHAHTLAHALTHTSGRRLAVASRSPPQAHTPAPRRLSDGGAPDGRPARGRRVVVLAAAAVAIPLLRRRRAASARDRSCCPCLRLHSRLGHPLLRPSSRGRTTYCACAAFLLVLTVRLIDCRLSVVAPSFTIASSFQ